MAAMTRKAQPAAGLDDTKNEAEEVLRNSGGTRLLCLTACLAVPALYTLIVRPRMLTWGATAEEVTGAYPGDELVPDPDGGATMACTLPARADSVWPWLVQMGGERAG